MGRVVQDFHVEHGGQAAETLRADPERVDSLKYFQAQFFQFVLRSARDQIADVDGLHQGFLRQQHGFFGAAADAHPHPSPPPLLPPLSKYPPPPLLSHHLTTTHHPICLHITYSLLLIYEYFF